MRQRPEPEVIPVGNENPPRAIGTMQVTFWDNGTCTVEAGSAGQSDAEPLIAFGEYVAKVVAVLPDRVKKPGAY